MAKVVVERYLIYKNTREIMENIYSYYSYNSYTNPNIIKISYIIMIKFIFFIDEM